MSQQVINRLQTNRTNSISRVENINKELEPIIKDLEGNYNIYLNYGIKRDELQAAITYYYEQINSIRDSKVLFKIKLDNEPINASNNIAKEREILANELERIKEKEEEFNDNWVKVVDDAIIRREELRETESSLIDEIADIALSTSEILNDKKNIRRQNKSILIDNIRIKSEYNENMNKINNRICELNELIERNTTSLDVVTGEMVNTDANPKVCMHAKKQLISMNNQANIARSRLSEAIADNNNSFKSDKFNECNAKYADLLNLKSVKEAELARIRGDMTECDNIISGNTDALKLQYAEFAKQNLAANNRMSIMTSRLISERDNNISKYSRELVECDNRIREFNGQIADTQGEILRLDTNYKGIADLVKRRTTLESEHAKLTKYIQDLTNQLNIYGVSLPN